MSAVSWTCECGVRVTGRAEHCVVPGCHQTFTSTRAADLHRVDAPGHPMGRRCLSVAEMHAHGRLTLNGRGYWSEHNPAFNPARRSSASGARTGDPATNGTSAV